MAAYDISASLAQSSGASLAGSKSSTGGSKTVNQFGWQAVLVLGLVIVVAGVLGFALLRRGK